MKKIGWLLLSLFLVTTMILISCGGTETTTTTGTGTTVTGTTTGGTTTGGTTGGTSGPEMVQSSIPGKMVEKPQYGGTMTYASATDVQGFDDCYTYQYLVSTLNMTNQPLMAGDWSKGPAGTGDVTWTILGITFMKFSRMCLAESYEIPDNQTIIFHIRQGIHFQNKPPVAGRELDAYDVEYSLKRNFETPGAYCNLTYKPGSADAPLSIKATNQWTVEIKCNAGKMGPLFIVTAGYCQIFPRDGVAAGGNFKDWKVSNGSGAYMLSDYVPQSSFTVVKNPDYWDTDPLIPGNKLPYIDKFQVFVIPDEAGRIAALKTAKIDALVGVTWDVAAALQKTNAELLSGRYLQSYSYSMKMALGKGFPWDNVKVRYALSMAIDRQKIMTDFFGGNATDFTYPVMPNPEEGGMFTPLSQLPQTVQDLYKHDVTKAKALLAEAGQSAGFTAEIIVTSASQQQQDLLALIASMWKDINVTLDIKPLENAVFTSQLNARSFKNMVFSYCGNSAPYKMNDWRPGNPNNAGNIDAPQLVDVYNQLNTMYPFDEPGAMALIKAQTPYILEQCWEITPPLADVFWFCQPWMKNFHGEVTIGYYQTFNAIQYRWIDAKLKAELRNK
jgi:peptide/nickel transport system substrate-binding protein